MTTDEKRQVAERIGNAKKELIDALMKATQAKAPTNLLKAIEAMCGKAEHLQRLLQR